MHRGDWDDLRYVLAVAQAGSLAAAARALGVNHSTVLRRLGAYETRLGVRLFDRHPWGYVPTAAGEEMVRGLAAVDGVIHDVERRAAGLDRRLTGTVRLSTTDTLVASVLPRALASVRAAHPGITLEVSTANAFAVLTRREADIALRPTPKSPPESLIGRQLAVVPYAVYGAPAYLDGRPPDTALADHAWLRPDASLQDTAAARWLRANLLDCEPVLRADTFVALRDLARAGIGLALLPCYLGEASEGLVRLPGSDVLDLASTLWVLTHEDLRRVARVDAVVTALVEGLATARWSP
ncbi:MULTISPECIES: LysR family transcriptional regulator [Methylobacterium]|jgi:DNA-binding transcriptional LysR family regulator|uniref:LysR family transcriptional regulator n=2 Tax=Methylobacterium TaxID=407 RepID=A0A2R4WMB2_9HYPH|nr:MULTISPECIES: LysR family transcriptional regulator [Methylobacterium]MBZ6414543.1 LysR family transcriptional regulator [Methylobacterium sp.]AWB22670.1 LysR family transcriptional regulator [Methylobacterium currus]MBK3401087.1 LysR family transcriptional regulator [Methylobacterium ajmalii]MBK3411291.1 LysR family transcriptional regulator [Methylobacterium ajmalii]MBK3422812.1 LysR family transcriptional regulator [Methylobacterium ajmalii]